MYYNASKITRNPAVCNAITLFQVVINANVVLVSFHFELEWLETYNCLVYCLLKFVYNRRTCNTFQIFGMFETVMEFQDIPINLGSTIFNRLTLNIYGKRINSLSIKSIVLIKFNCYNYIGFSDIYFYTISQTSLLPFYAEIFLLKSQPFMWSERYLYYYFEFINWT